MDLTITYTNFIFLTEEELLEILEWRNRPKIRENMTNSELISKEEHLRFCSSLHNRKDLKMYKVSCNGSGAGVISIKNIDLMQKTAEVGNYYIEQGIIPSKCALYADLLFAKLGIAELSCFVKKDNPKALMFNLVKLHGSYQREDDKYIYIKFKVQPQLIEDGIELEFRL